jgi:fructose-specific phosphotransferase system IIC component
MKRATNSQAGGFILAACIIGGTVAGAILRQPSVGFLIGLGAGILLAVIIWVIDRSR